MTDKEKMIMVSIRDCFAENSASVVRDDDNTLMEKPYRVVFGGETICYCDEQKQADLIKSAIYDHGQMIALRPCNMMFDGKIAEEVEKMNKADDGSGEKDNKNG